MKRANTTLNVLLGVIIAVIIVLAATKAGAKLFSTNDQGKDSLNDFVTSLKSVIQAENQHERERGILILDKETMVAYFTATQIKTSVQARRGESDLPPYNEIGEVHTITLNRPSSCTQNKPCFCFISEFEYTGGINNLAFNPVDSLCHTLEFPLYYQEQNNDPYDCSIGIQKYDPAYSKYKISYRCQGGFFIDRGVIRSEESSISTEYNNDAKPILDNPKRTAFVIAKEGDGVKIIELKP